MTTLSCFDCCSYVCAFVHDRAARVPRFRLKLISSKSLGRSSRNNSTNEVSFPHPQSGKYHQRKKDISSRTGVARKLFERTVDIAEYRNAKNEVNASENHTLVHKILPYKLICFLPGHRKCPASASWLSTFKQLCILS